MFVIKISYWNSFAAIEYDLIFRTCKISNTEMDNTLGLVFKASF